METMKTMFQLVVDDEPYAKSSNRALLARLQAYLEKNGKVSNNSYIKQIEVKND